MAGFNDYPSARSADLGIESLLLVDPGPGTNNFRRLDRSALRDWLFPSLAPEEIAALGVGEGYRDAQGIARFKTE